MKDPILVDETNIEGYLQPCGCSSDSKPGREAEYRLKGFDRMSESEASRDCLAGAVPSAAYDEASKRCTDLLRSLPSLHSSVGLQIAWSIPEALDQYSSLSTQHDILAEATRSRLRVRKAQLIFARLRAQDALKVLRDGSHVDSAVDTARRAASEVVRLQRLL